MKNVSLYDLTDCGGNPVILRDEDVSFVVIPIFETDDEIQGHPGLDSETMKDYFDRMLFNLEYQYQFTKVPEPSNDSVVVRFGGPYVSIE